MSEYKHCVACKKFIPTDYNHCIFCGVPQNYLLNDVDTSKLVFTPKDNNSKTINSVVRQNITGYKDKADKALSLIKQNTNTKQNYENSLVGKTTEYKTITYSDNEKPDETGIDSNTENATIKQRRKKVKANNLVRKKLIVAICFVSLLILSIVGAFIIKTLLIDEKNISELISQNNEEEILIEHEEEIQTEIDTIEPVIDRNGTYISEKQSLACVIIPDLRMRKEPAGDLIKEEYDDTKNKHAPMMCYAYLNEEKTDDINWLEIDKNVWIGTKDEWIKKSFINENKDFIADLSDIPDEKWSPLGPSVFSNIDKVQKIMECTDHELQISSFLKKTMPGLGHGSTDIIDFDSRNPSEEAKNALFYKLILNFHQYLFQNSDKKRQDDAIDLVIKQDQLNNGVFEYYLYNGFPEENLNYITNKLYGNAIDFRTVAWYVAQYNTYIYSEPTGFGCYDSMVNVIDYNETETEISVHGSVFCLDLLEMDNIYIVDEKYLKIDDNKEYLNNQAPKFNAVIRKTSSGEYQLVTVTVQR